MVNLSSLCSITVRLLQLAPVLVGRVARRFSIVDAEAHLRRSSAAPVEPGNPLGHKSTGAANARTTVTADTAKAADWARQQATLMLTADLFLLSATSELRQQAPRAVASSGWRSPRLRASLAVLVAWKTSSGELTPRCAR